MPAMMVVTPMMPMRLAVLSVMFAIVLPLFAQIVAMRALRAMVKPVSAISTIIVVAAVIPIFISVAVPAMAVMRVGRYCDVQEKCGQRGQQENSYRSQSHVSDSRVQRGALCSTPSV